MEGSRAVGNCAPNWTRPIFIFTNSYAMMWSMTFRPFKASSRKTNMRRKRAERGGWCLSHMTGSSEGVANIHKTRAKIC
jgi:hypothetical protein